MAACRGCGTELIPTGKRGRPPVLCPGCRAKKPAGHKRISPAVSVQSERIAAAPSDVAPGEPPPSPTPGARRISIPQACGTFEANDLNPRFCRHCLRWTWEHAG